MAIFIVYFLSFFSDGHTEANVQLIVPRYVERGTSATLECLHDVDPSVLFKVIII